MARLLDAQLLAQVYIELTGGRQIGLGLVAEAPAQCRERSGRRRRPRRGSSASRGRMPRRRTELARHRAFVAKIVNPLWDRFFAPTSERGAA